MSPIIILLLVLILFIIINDHYSMEQFMGGYQTYQQFVPLNPLVPFVPFNTYKYPSSGWFWGGVPYFNGYTDLPWENRLVGTTSNMSYDLRGDPMVIPRQTISPWNNPEVYPIYNSGEGVLN